MKKSSIGSILKNDSLTFSEKILSLKRCDFPAKIALAGDIIVASIDFSMATDGTGPLAIRMFKEIGAKKLWNPKKVLLNIDHTYPASSEAIAALHRLMREFAKEQGCLIQEGSIGHQYMLEQISTSGMLIVGADSHTTMHGALGAFATGLGSTEVASVWASGKTWFKVPESIRVFLEGKLPEGVYAKDIALSLIGTIKSDGANYKSIEYSGKLIKKLSIDSRASICNISMEAGAKAAIVEPDSVTEAFLESLSRKPIVEVHAGDKAHYEDEITIEVDKIEPLVAVPDKVDNVKAIDEVYGTPIDQAFLGSCTNGRLEDLEIAASIIKGHRVKDGVRFIITPASRKVFLMALRKGIIGELEKAGALVTNPTCGACVGTCMGLLASGEVCISSSNRNFRGRMGSMDSKVFLASPATVAASAIDGFISDPRRYLR
ncbi:MAG: 3-isopropylmalate dehydratase large subunit [Candidatus Bathyarchaeia archaeon]